MIAIIIGSSGWTSNRPARTPGSALPRKVPLGPKHPRQLPGERVAPVGHRPAMNSRGGHRCGLEDRSCTAEVLTRSRMAAARRNEEQPVPVCREGAASNSDGCEPAPIRGRAVQGAGSAPGLSRVLRPPHSGQTTDGYIPGKISCPPPTTARTPPSTTTRMHVGCIESRSDIFSRATSMARLPFNRLKL